MKIDDDPFDLANLRLPRDRVQTVTRTSRKIAKRREHFVRLPFGWIERLAGASGQTWHLAMHLLYSHWKGAGKPIKLANGMLQIDGISRATKWRALVKLESRGLIAIERRSGKSPLIHVHDLSQS
jgi:hypothetical protein